MNIFQIFLCDDEWLDWNLTNYKYFFESRKNLILTEFDKNCSYQLYTNESAKEFLFEFDREAFKCFNILKPYAFRADLLRYCLLYRYGGWHFDLLTKPLFRFCCNSENLIFFNSHRSLVENCVLYAQSSSKFYEQAIKNTIRNISNRYYNQDDMFRTLSVSGPLLLKRTFDQLSPQYKKNNFYYGKYINENNTNANLVAFGLYLGDKLFAIREKTVETSGNISYIGFRGTNNYNPLYHQRQIYNS